jgi:hypothetical protein
MLEQTENSDRPVDPVSEGGNNFADLNLTRGLDSLSRNLNVTSVARHGGKRSTLIKPNGPEPFINTHPFRDLHLGKGKVDPRTCNSRLFLPFGQNSGLLEGRFS